jgi:hypothetical protein
MELDTNLVLSVLISRRIIWPILSSHHREILNIVSAQLRYFNITHPIQLCCENYSTTHNKLFIAHCVSVPGHVSQRYWLKAFECIRGAFSS